MAWGDDLSGLATERGPGLVGYAYLLTGDLDGARDLVQEALIRTFGRPRGAADMAWLEAYVRRVILNIYLDAYRRERSWGRVRHLFVVPEKGSADDAARTADHVDVQEALADLPRRERACVVLRFYDDLTVPAIAERLGISEGAAKRYLSDGVRRLGSALGTGAAPDDADDLIDVRPGRSRR